MIAALLVVPVLKMADAVDKSWVAAPIDLFFRLGVCIFYLSVVQIAGWVAVLLRLLRPRTGSIAILISLVVLGLYLTVMVRCVESLEAVTVTLASTQAIGAFILLVWFDWRDWEPGSLGVLGAGACVSYLIIVHAAAEAGF